MTSEQVQFTPEELLRDHEFAEPLYANGVRCHGGFDEDGTYVSPRTKNRVPAIEAWEDQRCEQFGTDPLAIPLETWPESFPNIEQSKFLLRNGVRQPIISTLTRIGTVEGFGAMLRYLPVPNLHKAFDEDIRGTATEHLDRGLFEAHARDEAGFEEEAGHNTMWFAARDIAFENPLTSDQTEIMRQRIIGIAPGASAPDPVEMRRAAIATRVLPSDIDFDLESMLTRMVSILFIEISAYHSFAWAEGVLTDTDLCAGDGEAATIIAHVRADEAPHVAYLKVALSEVRDRSFVGESGRRHRGGDMIARVWDRTLKESRLLRRGDILRFAMREIDDAVEGRSDRDTLLEEFFSLGVVRRRPDGSFVERARDGRDVLIPA
jgi:hypothetical protein